MRSSRIDNYHQRLSKDPKKLIIKFSRHKDANKIRAVKKNMKGMNLSSIGINNPVYINNSFCSYYKLLWQKCKNLFPYKLIHALQVSNGIIKLKIDENN